MVCGSPASLSCRRAIVRGIINFVEVEAHMALKPGETTWQYVLRQIAGALSTVSLDICLTHQGRTLLEPGESEIWLQTWIAGGA